MGECDLRRRQTDVSFPMPLAWRDSLFSVLEMFPIPMEVFSSDGLSLFVNQAFSDFFRVEADEIVGKLNILSDPHINHKLGLTDYLRRVFAGEILSLYDIRAPFEEFGGRYLSWQSRPAENDMYQDLTCLPLPDEKGSVAYVVAVFMIKRVYPSRLDVIKAREYIDAHWMDDFDLDGIAGAASLSRDHLTRLFKRFIGMTPYSYYQEIKIERIKEALRDTSLSISGAFSSCGADYTGAVAQAFKRRVGMTPTQYRKSMALPAGANHRNPPGARKETGDPERSLPFPLDEMENQLFQIAGLFPIPIQIFKPSGDIVFINEAVLKMWNVLDTAQILGKYNLIRDPFVNEQFGLRDQIRSAFQGETVLIQDIRIPLESFWAWYQTRSAVYDIEAIYTDILNFSVFNANGTMAYVVSVFFTSRIYRGRSDVTKAREYLENHWREEFDIGKLAQAVYLSPSQLARLFKKHTGMTLYSYYQQIKINRIKAALRDKSLSVAEAFASCGFEYPGNFARFFKEKVGLTPSEYRATVGK